MTTTQSQLDFNPAANWGRQGVMVPHRQAVLARVMAGARNTGSDECQNRGEEERVFPDKNLRIRSQGSFATAHKVPMLENRRWFYRGFRAPMGILKSPKGQLVVFAAENRQKATTIRGRRCPCTHRRQRMHGSLRRSQATSRTWNRRFARVRWHFLLAALL
jgi:hypothetical protein